MWGDVELGLAIVGAATLLTSGAMVIALLLQGRRRR
jgi:hypothetical protein